MFTCAGSDLVEAEKTGIKIVESPYVVSFKDMPKYFKPGLPLDLTVSNVFSVFTLFRTILLRGRNPTQNISFLQILVSNHDGSPARNVLVKLTFLDTPLIASAGSARASINMPSDQIPQIITVSTNAG